MAATTASSCPPAGPDLPPTVNGTTSCASSSSSKKSLFDRVANFRRSLIKSEQKKNKIRPTSGSFNFFKPTSSSNLTENGAPTNGAKTVSPNGVCEYSGSTVEGTTVPNGQSQAAQAAHLGSASNLRHSIIVDEEDAIYGFTSLHLNNPTSLRRQLKSQQQAQQSQQSSSESNGRCSIRRTSTSSSSPSQLFTSSSCISLYETIDEVEPINGAAGGPVSSFSSSGDSSMDSSSKGTLAPAPPPLPPSNGKVHHHFTSKHRHSGHSSVSSRQLRLHSVPGEIDWRHRRSSAIIFSNDLHDLCLEDGGEEQPTSLQMGAPGYGPVINGHHQHHLNGGHAHRTGGDLATTTSAGQAHSMTCRLSGASHHSLHLHSSLNRSSDDLLLGRSAYFNHHPSMGHQHEIATDGSDQQSLPKPYVNGHCNGRIYENLLNGSLVNGGNYQQQHQHSQHSQSQHSHPKRSDNRKLTKDSGYESASTLVSLTGQLNGGSGGAPMPSSPNGGACAGLPPVQVASLSRSSFSAGGTHILMISPPPPAHSLLGNHAVHCRSDSLDSANSLCGDLQSPSPPLPNKCSQADSPPLPSPPSGMDSYDDCRPPTPPVRYSSLPQNRSFLHSGQSRPMPPPPPPTIPSGGGGLPPSHADLRSLLNRSMPSLWHQQMQSSFDSFDNHQVGRLSSAQLLTLIQQSGLPAFPPPPPPLPPPNSEPVLEYHHVRQDSCPSALPSTHPNGYPSMVSLSPGDPTQRRHTSKSVPLSSSSSTCDSAAGTLTSRYTRSAQTQAYSAKPYTVYNGASPTPDHRGSGFHLTQSPSLSSLQSNTAVPNGTSVRHSIASCSTATLSAVNGHGAHLPTGVPPTQQIVRSHRLPQVTRQELGVPAPKPHRAPLETSLDDFIGEVPGQASTSPPPPPLPPKNVSNGAFPTPKSGSTGDLRQCQLRLKTSPEQSSLTSDLKAIQKRAVYEFYLRQKEKKEKAKRSPTDSPSRRNSGSSSGSSTATLTSPISGTGEQCTSAKSQSHSEHEDDGIIEEEELPLPTPPPPLLASNHGAAVTMSSSQVNQFFADSPLHSAPLTEEEMAFPPPPTPVASFETTPPLAPFPAPPTPLTVAPIADMSPGSALSPAFPPPPTPTTATVMTLPVVTLPPPQMFHDIDLSHLWPSVDFSRLLQPLPMPPVKESLTLGEDYDSLEDQDEELASIEANRERQEADGWRVSQLEAEQCRLELEGQRNEEIIGQLVRSRLTGDLALDGNKLELLCKDMIMIIRLMVSIVQQLTSISISTPRPKGLQPGEKGARKVASQLSPSLSPSPLSPSSFSLVSSTTVAARVPAVASVIKTKAHSDSNGTVPTDANDVANNAPDGSEAAVGHCSDAASTTSKGPVDVRQEEKRIRLWDQLEEARRLRDNIETRRTMLQERLTRKCAARNSSPGTTTTTTTTNQSSMLLRLLMITGAKGEQGNVANIANGTPNGALDGYLASQLATDRTAADTTSRTTASAAASIGDIDLSTLIRCYLTQKEHLLVQSEVARLLLSEANSRIETPGSTVVGPVN